MKPFLLVAIGTVFVSLAAPAHAQAMPRYDVEAYCQKISDYAEGSEVIYNGCIEMEQDAYNSRKDEWSSIPAKTRDYCDEIARYGDGSYALLDGCLDMESDAAASTPTFQY